MMPKGSVVIAKALTSDNGHGKARDHMHFLTRSFSKTQLFGDGAILYKMGDLLGKHRVL